MKNLISRIIGLATIVFISFVFVLLKADIAFADLWDCNPGASPGNGCTQIAPTYISQYYLKFNCDPSVLDVNVGYSYYSGTYPSGSLIGGYHGYNTCHNFDPMTGGDRIQYQVGTNPGNYYYTFTNQAGTFGQYGPFALDGNGNLVNTSSFYAQIKNTSAGTANLYDATSTSANVLKRLPQDWIVYVASTTDASSSPITADGYHWYKVSDPTDNVSGWMIGEDASSTVSYLPYNASMQIAFAMASSNTIATTSDRANLILEAVDHYFDNASTTYSLYSSDDGTNNISDLKNGGFEKKVIWGMAARESGPSFNNEIVSNDFGHGIMQLTLSKHYNFDNRGYGNTVKIPPCSLESDNYLNCYTNSSDITSPKAYTVYSGDLSGFTYKYYVNTEQSIYSNIKDALSLLADKFDIYNYITASTTINGITYSPTERKILSTAVSYNGGCDYLDNVADNLDIIDYYFADATTSDISTLVSKMHAAGSDMICAQLHSPAELSIWDSSGKAVGIVNGKGRNDYPLAVYSGEEKFAKIMSPENKNYIYQVTGTGNGTFDLDITMEDGDREISFKAKEVPIVPGEVYRYNVNKNALLHGENGITVEIDKKGNGHIDQTFKIGAKETTVINKSKIKAQKPLKTVSRKNDEILKIQDGVSIQQKEVDHLPTTYVPFAPKDIQDTLNSNQSDE